MLHTGCGLGTELSVTPIPNALLEQAGMPGSAGVPGHYGDGDAVPWEVTQDLPAPIQAGRSCSSAGTPTLALGTQTTGPNRSPSLILESVILNKNTQPSYPELVLSK